MKQFDLTGKTAMVTGGSRGIGRALALGLARAGADVAIVYRAAHDAAESAAQAIREMGRQAWTFAYDLADTTGIDDLVATVWDTTGGIDILVNNAGIAMSEPFHKVTEAIWDRVLTVNLKAPFFLAKAVAVRLIDAGRPGRIINISSTNGFVAEVNQIAYGASKGGLELLTQGLAIELARRNITVNTVAPGLVRTDIIDEFEFTEGFEEHILEHIPLGRWATPEECVGPVILLASEAGQYITGQHIILDGGLLAEQFPRHGFVEE